MTTDREDWGYCWAWGEFTKELDQRITCYHGKEAGLHPEARGWLECLRYMRRKTKALARRMRREGSKATLGPTVQKMWDALMADGETECPCCGRYMKVYRRRIHHEMAYFLIWLVFQYEGGREWVHISTFPSSRSGDYAKLMYWDLIEPRPKEDDPKKRDSGWWRPTEDGVRFARSHLAVPEYALVFDGEVQEYAGGGVFIRDALGTKFDYEELMRNIEAERV